MANPNRPSGPPDPPGPDRTQGKKGRKPNPRPPAPSAGRGANQTGIMDFFQPRQRTPSQSAASGVRGTESTLPASSSDPQLTRGTGGASFPPGRPRAPTIESLASGIGSLTTLPSSLGRGGPSTSAAAPGSPSLGRAGLSTSAAPGSPSLGRGSPSTSAAAPGSPSLGRGGLSTSAAPGSPSLGRGGPLTSTAAPGSPSLGRGGPSTSTAPKVICKTFRVVKPLDEEEVKTLNSQVGAGFVSLKVGDFGIIPNVPANVMNGNLHPHPWVQLLRQGPVHPITRSDTPLNNGRCRVPKSIIEIGTFVRQDVELVDETNLSNLTLRLQLSPNMPLQKFLESFLASLSAAETITQLKFHGVSGKVADVISQPNKCRQFVKEFLNGMDHCRSLRLLQNGLPKLSKIWSELRHVNSEASNAPFTKDGIFFYMLIYYNEKSGAIAVYIGKTINPLARYKQHSKALLGNDELMHYQVARRKLREGATHRLIPIAFLPKHMPDAKLFEAWAETFLAVLFDSFSPVMLNKKQPSPSNELPPDELAQLSKSLERDSYHQACGAPLGKLLLNATGRIKNSDSSLKGFNSDERITGLNWSVPLCEAVMKEANLWIRSTIHGDGNKPAMWEFRTHPRRLTKERFVFIFYGRTDTLPFKFRPVVPAELTSLVGGSLVNVVIEITINPNDKHPYAYARMPTVGPFDCWNEASRLAVRFEFEDEQGWHTQYLKQEKVQVFSARIKSSSSQLGDEVDHIDLGWLHSIKILAALLNWEWNPPDNALARRVWVPYSNRLRVIEFDFFNQRLVVGNCQPTSKPIPRLLTLNETSRLIEEKFGHGVHIGSLPDLALINVEGSAIRTKCDLCLMGDRGGQMLSLPRKCKDRWVVTTVNGQKLWQCEFSFMMNRYCTFTRGIENRPDLRDLVYHVADGHYPIQHIAPPPNVFQYLEVREKLEEEPVEED